MKIKYKDSDKVLIAMGSDVGVAQAGEIIEDTLLGIPSDSIDNYTRTALGVFTRKNQGDIDSDIVAKKLARKNRKQALRTKLGLTKQEIKHLVELIQDGDDD